jgi:hypothetical protein
VVIRELRADPVQLSTVKGRTVLPNVLATAGAGGPPVEGDNDEAHGGDLDDKPTACGSAPPARARTPVNDLDDHIRF